MSVPAASEDGFLHLAEEAQYLELYYRDCQGDFYGSDYYQGTPGEHSSSILYVDDLDKITLAQLFRTCLGPGRVLEVGCAMGLLVRQLVAFGIDAQGVDFSDYCIRRAPPEVAGRLQRMDLLDLRLEPDQFDCLLVLDVLEHLPPQLVPQALTGLCRILKPGGILFCVLPAYGDNAFGPTVFPFRGNPNWERDAALGRPFRDLPADRQGRPHLGHLTHATIYWWESVFQHAGLRRQGRTELEIHRLCDGLLEPARRAFFVFRRLPSWRQALADRAHSRRLARIARAPYGFFYWERWGGQWVRWTQREALDFLDDPPPRIALPLLADHPDLEQRPVEVEVTVAGRPAAQVKLERRAWLHLELEMPPERRVFYGLKVSRLWVPAHHLAGNRDERELGVAVGAPQLVR
jgi:SAM-dependent methyltransferase